MNSTEFTYQLQGFFELSESKELNEKQVQIIKDHLNLVFNKVTPDYKTDKHTKTMEQFLMNGFGNNIKVEPLKPGTIQGEVKFPTFVEKNNIEEVDLIC